ncbi:MAG: patatin-like phospholipase family protein [Actinomycetota bacterium]
MPSKKRPPTIGLVLGGGGIAGYAFHAAVLRAVTGHTGFDPRTAEVIVGTSAGSIAGALLRGAVPASAIADRLWAAEDDPQELANLRLLAGRSSRVVPRFWTGIGSTPMTIRELRRGRRMKLARLAGGLLPDGRLTLDPIIRPLDGLHGAAWPEQALWIPATDRTTGRRVVFGRDRFPRVAEAVRASAALPGFFAPAEIEDRTYIDGGLGSQHNADLLADHRTAGTGRTAGEPLDLVIVSAPLSIDELSGRVPMASAIRAVPRRQLQEEILKIEAVGTKTLVFEPDNRVTRSMGLNPMNHHRIRSILTATDRMTHQDLAVVDDSILRLLEGAGRLLRSPPDVPYPEITVAEGG